MNFIIDLAHSGVSVAQWQSTGVRNPKVWSQKPVTTSSTPDEREPVPGFTVIPYIWGVMEPIRSISNSHNIKVAQTPFQTLGIFLPNLRIMSRTNNELTPFILFLATTVTMNTLDRPNACLAHI